MAVKKEIRWVERRVVRSAGYLAVSTVEQKVAVLVVKMAARKVAKLVGESVAKWEVLKVGMLVFCLAERTAVT